MTGDFVDVVIVGAGLSGDRSRLSLRLRCPGKSFVLLEARDAIGGTWDLFRYPGIRSDSDMYTLGYSFRPWTNPRRRSPTGRAICAYPTRDGEGGLKIDKGIRYGLRMRQRAQWSSKGRRAGRWRRRETKTGERSYRFTCKFLVGCAAGYYRLRGGYTPRARPAASASHGRDHPIRRSGPPASITKASA